MPSLDLTRFHGIDPLRLTPNDLDIVRYMFADSVTDCAAQCANNAQLLDALFLASSPESGLPLPYVLGEGSTRRVWSLPFGMVMKLERTDELEPAEMEWRGSREYLQLRRRVALVGEIITAMYVPQLVPKVFGFILSFGVKPPNPAVSIVERTTPLSEIASPEETIGIPRDHLFQSGATGELLIVDPRFPTPNKPAPTDRTVAELLPGGEAGTWLGNIGTDAQGRFYLIDTGNNSLPSINNQNPEFLPEIDFPGVSKWKRCAPLSHEHLTQTKLISRQMFTVYLRRLAASERTAPAALQAA